jgi:hypothetical protein
MRTPRDLVTAVQGRLRRRADAHQDVIERLDRINHWVTHIDARQQQLAGLNHLDDKVRDQRKHLDDETSDLRHRLDHLMDELRVARSQAEARDIMHGELLANVSRTAAVLTEQVAWIDPPRPADDGPLVTVVCPVRDRAELFDRALASVRAQTYPRWECLVVDDGSRDVDDDVVARWSADARVRVVRTPPDGPGAARNRALAESTGEIVAYLDADNTFHPTYLARVVDALDRHPEASWTVATQLVVGHGIVGVRDDRHDLSTLDAGNFIDINAVAHQRSLVDRVGHFDESLRRLGDWDLIQRFAAAAGDPARITAMGSTYDARPSDSISRRVPLHPHQRRLLDRSRGTPAAELRVLFAEWHFPQVSESYVRADMVGLRALGAHVEAWSEDGVAVPYEPGVPVHRGELRAAIDGVRPDVVVSHWLNIGAGYRSVIAEVGVPHAVRGHGFEFDAAVIDGLLDEPGVAVQLFPHLVDLYGRAHPRLARLPVGFDQDLFPPTPDKDPRLVVRTGAALLTKDYESFFEVATRCPEHRFVLALCRAYQVEHQLDEIVARRHELGAPVEIVVDLPHEKAADLVASAGIYLHTHGTAHPLGMPISIAESMGTGCYVLGRDLPGMAGYLGGAGDLYRDAAHAAALVQQTVHWDDDRWTHQWRVASDHAHIHYGASDVALSMLRQWRDMLGVRFGN